MLTYPEESAEQATRRQAAGLLMHAANLLRWDAAISAEIQEIADRLKPGEEADTP